jgi:hypothetical protein
MMERRYEKFRKLGKYTEGVEATANQADSVKTN